MSDPNVPRRALRPHVTIQPPQIPMIDKIVELDERAELIDYTREVFTKLEQRGTPQELTDLDIRSLETDQDICDVLNTSRNESCDPVVKRQCFEELMLGKADGWKIRE